MRQTCLSIGLLLAAAPCLGSCWAEYDSCMHGILARQGISAPSRAASFSSLGECRSALSSMMSDPVYRGDACLGRTRCECDGSSGGSGGFSGASGGSFEQQIVGMAMNAFFNALFASDQAGSGPSAEALRAEAQRKWADLEKVRLDSEKRVTERAFAAAKGGALKDLGGRSTPAPMDGPSIKEGGTPALLRGDWKKAVSKPGLSQAERTKLRMSLPSDGSSGASVDLDGVLKEREALSAPDVAGPLMPLLEGSVTYGVGAAVEQGGEALLSGYGERGLAFGDAYAVGGVVMAFQKGKKEEAAAPAVNWALGKIPGAGLATGTAQGVAAVTTAVFRKSWDNFTEEVEKVVPGVLPEGGAEAFWRDEVKGGASTGQRAVFEWLGL